MTEDTGRRRLRRAVAPHLTRQNGVLVLVSLGILVMVVFTQLARPAIEFDSNAFAPSFKETGEIGKPIELRNGTLTITKLRLAKSVRTEGTSPEDKEPVTTPGIWVVVDYHFLGARKSESLQPKLVTIDHTNYRASSRPGSGVTTSILGDPGFRDQGTLAFEVPKSALAGSSITAGADSPFGDALSDTKAVVSLELDGARAAQLVRQAPATLTL